ncbi:aldehyde reductase [Listeria sp. PSOL-1]|uniref:SDR family oxidoreductase n=1 Tax=Listeria sp. PSOL-1 TaxID=1844999 RepID=UPI0013D14F29|nr:aldehyde reductase [Listeria sp. PSOL-1]
MKEQVLVTGGTGFMGLHIIFQLLKGGYRVKTTVRSLARKDEVLATLSRNGIQHLEELTFIEADLSSDEHWEEAMKGCSYVLSVASPVFFDIPKNEDEAIRPAVEGILRILKAASKADVKRVVMTSNFGAIGFSNKDLNTVTTEKDWTDEFEKGLSIYEKSKLLAEKAAWDFVEKENELELVTINPVAVFGPSLNRHVSESFNLLKMLINPNTKRIPNLPLNVVDVRDVADLHIRAMTNPKAAMQRFIASSDGEISLLEIAQLIKRNRPELADQVVTKTVPNWQIKLASLFSKHAKEGRLFLEMNRQVSNSKAKELLEWQPISTKEEAALLAVDSLEKNTDK